MNAINPLCESAVMPIMAINKIIIGNMKNFRFKTYNSNNSFMVPILKYKQFKN